jgi:hypothetical protein
MVEPFRSVIDRSYSFTFSTQRSSISFSLSGIQAMDLAYQ